MSVQNYRVRSADFEHTSVVCAGEGILIAFSGNGRKKRAATCAEEINQVLDRHEKAAKPKRRPRTTAKGKTK